MKLWRNGIRKLHHAPSFLVHVRTPWKLRGMRGVGVLRGVLATCSESFNWTCPYPVNFLVPIKAWNEQHPSTRWHFLQQPKWSITPVNSPNNSPQSIRLSDKMHPHALLHIVNFSLSVSLQHTVHSDDCTSLKQCSAALETNMGWDNWRLDGSVWDGVI